MSNKNTSSYLGNSRAESNFYQNFKNFVNVHLHSTEPTQSIFEIAKAPLFMPASPLNLQEYLDNCSDNHIAQNLENIALIQAQSSVPKREKKTDKGDPIKKKENPKDTLDQQKVNENIPQKIVLVDSDNEEPNGASNKSVPQEKDAKSSKQQKMKPIHQTRNKDGEELQHKSEPILPNKVSNLDDDAEQARSFSNREVVQKIPEDTSITQSGGKVLKSNQSPMKRQTTLTPKDQLNAETIEEEPDYSESASANHTVKKNYPGDESEFTDDQIDADLMKNQDLESLQGGNLKPGLINIHSEEDSGDTDDMIERQLRDNDEDRVSVKEDQPKKSEAERQRMENLILRLKENEESNRKATEFKRARKEAKEKKNLEAHQTFLEREDQTKKKQTEVEPKSSKNLQEQPDDEIKIVVAQLDQSQAIKPPIQKLLASDDSSFNETDDEIAADLAKYENGSVRPSSKFSGQGSKMESQKKEKPPIETEGSSNLLVVSPGKDFGRTNTSVKQKSSSNLNKSQTSNPQKMGIQREETFYRNDSFVNVPSDKLNTNSGKQKTSTLGMGDHDDNEKFSLGDSKSQSSSDQDESQHDELEDDEGPLKPSNLAKRRSDMAVKVNDQKIEEMSDQSEDDQNGVPKQESPKTIAIPTALGTNQNQGLLVKQKSFVRSHTQKEDEPDHSKAPKDQKIKNSKEPEKQKTMSRIEEKISEEDTNSVKKQSTAQKFSQKPSKINSFVFEGSKDKPAVILPVKVKSQTKVETTIGQKENTSKVIEDQRKEPKSPKNQDAVKDSRETSTLLKQIESQSDIKPKKKQPRERPSNDPFRTAQKTQVKARDQAEISASQIILESQDPNILKTTERGRQIQIKPLFEAPSREKRNLEKSKYDDSFSIQTGQEAQNSARNTAAPTTTQPRRLFLATLTNSVTAQPAQNKRVPKPQQRLISNNISHLESPYDLSHSNNILRAGFRVEVVIPQNESLKIYPSKYKIRRLKTKELNRDQYVSDRNGAKDDFLRTNFVPFKQIDDKEKKTRMKQLSRISELTQSNFAKQSISPQHQSLKFGYKFDGQGHKVSNPNIRHPKPFDVRKLKADNPGNRNNYLKQSKVILESMYEGVPIEDEEDYDYAKKPANDLRNTHGPSEFRNRDRIMKIPLDPKKPSNDLELKLRSTFS